MDFTPEEVLNAFMGTRWIHGSTIDSAREIIKEGLLIRSTDFPTVVSISDTTEALNYSWYEPRSNSKSCNIYLNIPREITENLKKQGKTVSQKNVFDVICEDIELTVPDTEETRHDYRDCQQNKSKYNGVLGPKFSLKGAKPGSKYSHIGIPPIYIGAIIDEDKQILYVSNEIIEQINKNREYKAAKTTENEELITLESSDKYFL